jgi:hypothetical protein
VWRSRHLHLLHAHQPGLGFVGIPLSVPCPIPFFEIQAAYLGEHWAHCRDDTTDEGALTTRHERMAWCERREPRFD